MCPFLPHSWGIKNNCHRCSINRAYPYYSQVPLIRNTGGAIESVRINEVSINRGLTSTEVQLKVWKTGKARKRLYKAHTSGTYPGFCSIKQLLEVKEKNQRLAELVCVAFYARSRMSQVRFPGVTSNPFFHFCPFCVDSNTRKVELWRREGWKMSAPSASGLLAMMVSLSTLAARDFSCAVSGFGHGRHRSIRPHARKKPLVPKVESFELPT